MKIIHVFLLKTFPRLTTPEPDQASKPVHSARSHCCQKHVSTHRHIVLSSPNLIPGFEKGLLEMQEGDKKTINIPFDQAH